MTIIKKISLSVDILNTIFEGLCWICKELESKAEFISLKDEYEIIFPDKTTETLSKIITMSVVGENVIENHASMKALIENKLYSEVMEHINNMPMMCKLSFDKLVSIVKNDSENVDVFEIANYRDYKKAFSNYVGGNLRALLGSKDDYRYAYWNGKAWQLKTKEETELLYSDFIRVVTNVLELKNINAKDEQRDEIEKLIIKVEKWDTDARCKESLSYIRRDRNKIINLTTHQKEDGIICSKDGQIINFGDGTIRKANRSDLILNTSRHSLKSKEESIKFVEENIMNIYRLVLDDINLKWINDFITFKLMGKGMQLVVFNGGVAGAGKSFYYRLVSDILGSEAMSVQYQYLTTEHKGNVDSERDDTIYSLHGKKVALLSEPERSSIISTGRIKRLTGGSTIPARQTRGSDVRLNDISKLDLFIDSNYDPRFTDMDAGISRRLVMINFENPIPFEKRNPNYYKDIIEPNLDYVFSYYVYRGMELRHLNRLEIPKEIEEYTQNKIGEIDLFAGYIKDNYSYCENDFVTYDQIKTDYEKYCIDNNIEFDKNINAVDILNKITSINSLINVKKKRKIINGSKVYVYTNIVKAPSNFLTQNE